MDGASMRLRGRIFTPEDLFVIKKITRKYFGMGRSRISQEICRSLKWYQPNGWPKDRACRDVLIKLNQDGIISLPPPIANNGNSKASRCTLDDSKKTLSFDYNDLANRTITHYQVPCLREVRGTPLENDWNYLVSFYHYQGYNVLVGQHLKYIAFYDDVPIACLGWGSPAWAIKPRDQWIGWSNHQRQVNLSLILNNVRFLILPWVKVKNLASTLLALSERIVRSDWHSFYNTKPVLFETFVEKDRFDGVCYKAANWIEIGETKGFGKNGDSSYRHGVTKKIFLRPLGKAGLVKCRLLEL